MSQITIRKNPQNIESQIRALAQKNNSRICKIIIDLLEKALSK